MSWEGPSGETTPPSWERDDGRSSSIAVVDDWEEECCRKGTRGAGGSMAWLHRRNLGEGILGGGQHGLVAQEESMGGNIGRGQHRGKLNIGRGAAWPGCTGGREYWEGAAQREAEYCEGGSMAWLHRRNLGEGILGGGHHRRKLNIGRGQHDLVAEEESEGREY